MDFNSVPAPIRSGHVSTNDNNVHVTVNVLLIQFKCHKRQYLVEKRTSAVIRTLIPIRFRRFAHHYYIVYDVLVQVPILQVYRSIIDATE